jgi:deaminated glutathione amidase
MPREITLSIVQTSADDDDVAGNIARMAAHLDTAGRRRSDVVVLPEVWPGTGFSRDGRAAEIAEPLPGGPAVAMLQEKAREHGMHVIGSLYERGEGGRIHNTAPVIGPSGEILARYRKTHLFDAEGRPDLPSVLDESRKVAAGDALVVAETNLCRMGVAICSDLRFPEVFRELALRGAELVVLPTAFLAPRLDHWEFLLRARATDNQVFVAAAGMVGRERHSGIGFVGRSMVVDPWGVIRACAADEEGVLTTVVDLDAVPRVRGWWDLLGQRRPALYERQREEHAG